MMFNQNMGQKNAFIYNRTRKLTIIIPAYNEVTNLENGCLHQVINYCNCLNHQIQTNILVVDDGSTDDTFRLLQLIPDVNSISIRHGGKFAALTAGVWYAASIFNPDVVLLADLDNATPIESLWYFLMQMDEHNQDCVIGNRGLSRHGASRVRKIVSVGQYWLRSILLPETKRFQDTQCGFKVWKIDSLCAVLNNLVVHSRVNRWVQGPAVNSGFDTEMLLVADRLGYQIGSVDVDWNHKPSKNVRVVREIIRGTIDLLEIWSAKAQGLYAKNYGEYVHHESN